MVKLKTYFRGQDYETDRILKPYFFLDFIGPQWQLILQPVQWA